MYLTIMNLPRNMRFKQENVILVGLIPGPSEPEIDSNDYLNPLVKELLQHRKGVEMNLNSLEGKVLVRGALLCISCDIPACRKVCGFLGHCANLGCSKCLKVLGFGAKDYSGFDKNLWPQHSLAEHRRNVDEIKECTTKTGRDLNM